MRQRYLVCYDISEPKRWSRVHKITQGFGSRLQYSVFCCDLSDKEKVMLVSELSSVINHKEDRIMIAKVAPARGSSDGPFEFIGTRKDINEIRQRIL